MKAYSFKYTAALMRSATDQYSRRFGKENYPPGVHSVELGFKYVENRWTNRICIRFHVRNKYLRDELLKEQIIPSRIGDFITDVIVTNIEYNNCIKKKPQRKVRPLLGGIEIWNKWLKSPGSLGMIVRSQKVEGYCGLTAHHVVFGSDPSRQSENGLIDEMVIQQNANSRHAYTIGSPTQAFSRPLDCVLIKIKSSIKIELAQSFTMVPGIVTGTKEPTLNLPVFKVGRTSNLTWGRVDGIELFYKRVSIRPTDLHPAAPPISEPGDSGAIWTFLHPNGTLSAIALHTKGNPQTPRMAFGTRMSAIRRSLKIYF